MSTSRAWLMDLKINLHSIVAYPYLCVSCSGLLAAAILQPQALERCGAPVLSA